jgi:hypothetical protein
MSVRRSGVVALLAIGALWMSGCASAPTTYPGVPEGYTGDALTAEIGGAWIDEGRSFAIVTWGSSSCPARAGSVDAVDARSIAVEFDSAGGDGPCTADMAATTHEFELPAAVTERPITVTVTHARWDGVDTFVLD